MKTFRFASLCLVAAVSLPLVTSCTSDRSPFDMSMSTVENSATIQLRFSVADTRAGQLSTAEENEIKKVTVHVFDENQKLESTKSVNVTSGTNAVNLEVSHGLKTIYVITSRSNVNPSIGTSLTNYENSVFNSSLANLRTGDGFVMVGKSLEQQVMITASQEELPASNIFDIELVRLVAKAQVKSSAIDGSSFGINFGAASFKAFQTSDRMRVVHNGSDIFETYVDGNNNGTYDYYSLGEGISYQNAVTSDFTAAGCAYMSENIVSIPKSGNTTFLSVRYATSPVKYYSFSDSDSAPKTTQETPAPSTTYYAVGIQDKTNGVVDYALDSKTKHIVAFKNQEDAERYMNSLNVGSASAFTVSQSERPLKAPGIDAEASSAPQFEVVKFDSGYAYYRVNIAHEDTSGDAVLRKIKVMRNKFYKVNINSVRSLGFSSEALLRPANPEAVLDAEGHSWISASISVADWDEVIQNVDL